jgi:hypothetical protein
MVMLYFSKYSNIKLGKDTDKPEYNDISWDQCYKTFFVRNLLIFVIS